jgi:hypothetical protein
LPEGGSGGALGWLGCFGVVVGLADDALLGGGGAGGCPGFVLGGAEDRLAGLLFWIGGRLVILLIELFITPDMSIGFGT